MTLLLLDTSGEYGVLALAEPDTGALRASRAFLGRRTLSRRLLGEVDGLLAGEGMTLDDVTAFGVGLGPGSFTGVRVGVTTAKTLAQVTGRPLAGVPTPDGYAGVWDAGVWDAGGLARVVVVLPSRRGEVYAAVYHQSGHTSEPFAESVEALERRLEAMEGDGPVVVCGAVGLLARRPRLALALPHVPPDGLARAAARRLSRGLTDDPLALTPLYVVPPAISTPKSASVLPRGGE